MGTGLEGRPRRVIRLSFKKSCEGRFLGGETDFESPPLGFFRRGHLAESWGMSAGTDIPKRNLSLGSIGIAFPVNNAAKIGFVECGKGFCYLSRVPRIPGL